ncbi:MAG: serine--tRNA ligase [Bacteroidales bacterium]|jgi:seryl-tRNA synthetase|nr:serine--tRNA ligase [Bacteroidales bacterium]
MLTINLIRENPSFVIERLKVKNFDATATVTLVLDLDRRRRELQTESDSIQAELNSLSREIGAMMKEGRKAESESARSSIGAMKEKQKQLADTLGEVSAQMQTELVKLPNMPHQLVAPGKSAEDNVIVRSGGEIPQLNAGAVPHWDLIRKYDIIDFDLGIKITGAGFPVYKGKGARLQRALINFFLDEGGRAGYREIEPPIVVNEDSGFGTGQLPDKEGQMYHVGIDNLYMIPTAEVPITNIYRDVILDAAELPVKNVGYTPCFRREAGSWGAHVRGLNRLHQFDKVEIVQIAHPDKSYEALEEMVEHVESLLAKLELPYRIVRLCGGDMSFTSAMTYDFEVWSAAQQRWLEVSSTSNFEAFQANRLRCRFREKGAKQTTLCHTLNGSALALPRIVAALLENNQTPEGIKIPAVLIPYTGFDLIS